MKRVFSGLKLLLLVLSIVFDLLFAGRGFTLDELKAAGILRKEAQGLGISVDHRRRNLSQESFQNNVNRLRTYKAKLIVFPRCLRRPKAGDSTPEELKVAEQVTDRDILPITFPQSTPKARTMTAEEKARDPSDPNPAWSIVRKNKMEAKLWGIREKRAKEKVQKEAATAAKAAKKAQKGK